MEKILTLHEIGYEVLAKTILSDISFEVRKGEYLSLSGPSGGGKSTLLKIIATLLSPTNGDILFQQRPQHYYPITEYRQLVSYCFQQPTLFGETVQDNLAFPYLIRGKEFVRTEAENFLTKVDLSTEFLAKPITELSGGERQRVALIRNLLFQPEILLLDEVTVGLDEDSKRIVQQLVRSVHQAGVTIIQVSHDEEDVAQANRKIRLAKGKVVSYESVSGQ